MRYSLTVRGRRFLREIKSLREDLGLKPEEAAQRVGWSRATVYRAEKGEKRLYVEEVEELLQAYGATSPQYEALTALCRDAWKRGWWLGYTDVYKDVTYFVLEDDATRIGFHALTLLPGLFQTEDYARALIKATHPGEAPVDIERLVEARTARHRLLKREDPPQIVAVLDEAILRRQVGGPDVTGAQLHKLLDLAEHTNITVHVMPFDVGAHAAMDGEFTLLGFPDEEDPDVPFQEGLFGAVYCESPREQQRYSVAFDMATKIALGPADSMTMIKAIAEGE